VCTSKHGLEIGHTYSTISNRTEHEYFIPQISWRIELCQGMACAFSHASICPLVVGMVADLVERRAPKDLEAKIGSSCRDLSESAIKDWMTWTWWDGFVFSKMYVKNPERQTPTNAYNEAILAETSGLWTSGGLATHCLGNKWMSLSAKADF